MSTLRHTKIHDAALEYARRGWPIFPIHHVFESAGQLVCSCAAKGCGNAGKHPLSKYAPRGFHSATTNPDKISHIWTCAPLSHIGLWCRDYVVIDTDLRPGKDGEASLAALEGAYGPLPKTWTVRTPTGGLHRYFKMPASVQIKNTRGELGKGIDTRGCDGYVLLPPSGHICGGTYRWEISPKHMPEAANYPEWAIKATQKVRQAKSSEFWRDRVRSGLEFGNRHQAVLEMSGLLLGAHRRRYPLDAFVCRELVQAWVASAEDPLPVDEVDELFGRVAAREEEKLLAGFEAMTEEDDAA